MSQGSTALMALAMLLLPTCIPPRPRRRAPRPPRHLARFKHCGPFQPPGHLESIVPTSDHSQLGLRASRAVGTSARTPCCSWAAGSNVLAISSQRGRRDKRSRRPGGGQPAHLGRRAARGRQEAQQRRARGPASAPAPQARPAEGPRRPTIRLGAPCRCRRRRRQQRNGASFLIPVPPRPCPMPPAGAGPTPRSAWTAAAARRRSRRTRSSLRMR